MASGVGRGRGKRGTGKENLNDIAEEDYDQVKISTYGGPASKKRKLNDDKSNSSQSRLTAKKSQNAEEEMPSFNS